MLNAPSSFAVAARICPLRAYNPCHSLSHSWLVAMDGLAPWATAALTQDGQDGAPNYKS